MRGVATMRAGQASARGDHVGTALGSPAVGPRITSRSSDASAMLTASGPFVERSIHDGGGSCPINPPVGFSPTSPQNAAGIRIDPPPSVPVANGAMPAASPAPLPPLEPPGDQSRAQGSCVSPKSRFAVNPSNANSGTLVFPTTI